MPSSARSILTRLLPWAALAVMTVVFFLQVRERRRLVQDLSAARDAQAVAHMTRPRREAPKPPPSVELGDVLARAELEARGLREEQDALRDALAAERTQARTAIERAERLEGLRATERARGDALQAELARARERLAALDEAAQRQAAGEARAAARTARVRTWLEAVEAGGQRRADALRDAQDAEAQDLLDLRSVWTGGEGRPEPESVAVLLGAMPAGAEAAALAVDLLEASPKDAGVREALGPLAAHPFTLALQVERGDAGTRAALLASVTAAQREDWDEAGVARMREVLLGLLAAEDERTLQVSLGALRRLRIPEHAGRVLPFLDHPSPEVRIAAIYALVAASERDHAVRTLRPYVVRLLQDERADVRMSALFLAQELAGEQRSLAFGSSDEDVAAEIERLKARLAALAGE